MASYERDGFAIVTLFDRPQVQTLTALAKGWVYDLLKPWVKGAQGSYRLDEYHLWSEELGVDHDRVFCARNRYARPSPRIRQVLVNELAQDFLSRVGAAEFDIWEGDANWLGFRFIRPGSNDGYPFSRKAWGPASNVISCWIPVVGYDPEQTLTLVPGSHLKEYERKLSEDKFASGKYRLASSEKELERVSPQLQPGEVIFYHPKTLHSENVTGGDVTRLSLEFRIVPRRESGASGA